jgi:hypothetical protein
MADRKQLRCIFETVTEEELPMPIHHHIDSAYLSNHFYLSTTHRHTLILCIVTPGWAV